MFANMPRVVCKQDEYTLTPEELAKKEHNNEIYSKFLRTKREKRLQYRKSLTVPYLEDYDLTNKKCLLMEHKQKFLVPYKPFIPYTFIPLPPEKLMDVIIKPKYVYLGKVSGRKF